MIAIVEISKLNILKEVMRAIESARGEILATMDLSEEIRDPLPRKYFLLLNKKLDDGISIKRLAFGTKADFMTIKKRHAMKRGNYQMMLVKTREYQRMLLIDQECLFFAKGKGGKQRFFFTADARYIKKYFRYFLRQISHAEH